MLGVHKPSPPRTPSEGAPSAPPEVRKQLYSLLDDVADSHEPIQIAGKRHPAVLVSEDDWNAVQETLWYRSEVDA